jgi:sugar phosphate permease
MRADEKRARRAALGAILLNMVSMGGYKTISLYLRPLSEALNVQITALTLLFTCQGIISFFVSLLLGKFVKKLGVRKIVSIAAICYGLFYVSLGVAHSVYIIYIGALLFGFASMAGGTAMAHIVITWWYDKGRAQVLSLTNIGLGIFSFILSPVISSLIGGLGVQNAAMVQGVVSAALMLVIALTLLSEEPSVYGMKPVGYVETSAGAKETAANGGSNARRMVATYQFWLILLGSFFVVFVLTGYSSNAAVIYQSMGLTDAQSSWCLSVYSIAALVWAPLFGTLVEKKGVQVAVPLLALVSAVTLFSATVLTGFVPALIVSAFMAFLSLASMIGSVTLPKVFGAKEAATLIGYANVCSSISAMTAPTVAAFVFQRTGSYHAFLLVGAALSMLCAVFILIATSRKSIDSLHQKLESA